MAYKFDENSLEFLKSVIIQEQDFYASFGYVKGKYLVDNVPVEFKFSLEHNGKEINLLEQVPVSKNLNYFYSAHSEFKMGYVVQKGTSYVDAADIVQDLKYQIDDVNYRLRIILRFVNATRAMELITYFDASQKTKYKVYCKLKENQYEVSEVKDGSEKENKFFLGNLEF